MNHSLDLIQDWRLLLLILGLLGVAPGLVMRILVRAYPTNHPRRRELYAELCNISYLERPLFVAQHIELAIFEGLPSRWRARRRPTFAASRRERLSDWRRTYFPFPDELVDDYLTCDEYVIHYDCPSLRTFVLRNSVRILTAVVTGALLANLLLVGPRPVMPVSTVLVVNGVLMYLIFRWLKGRYTSYIITNLRLIRLSGLLGRKLMSIPWTRTVSIGYRQSATGWLLGYATIELKLVNAESGLRQSIAVSELCDPACFHEKMLDMVSGNAGPWDGEESPPPPTKGVRMSRRQMRREWLAQSWVARQRAAAAAHDDGTVMSVRGSKPTVHDDLYTLGVIAIAVGIGLVGLVSRRRGHRCTRS